jgi:hypothetical protein
MYNLKIEQKLTSSNLPLLCPLQRTVTSIRKPRRDTERSEASRQTASSGLFSELDTEPEIIVSTFLILKQH